ncbi:hypothetical protein CLU79DRAFT_753091 [Phycomyces nitens]|nr:hypothetical protein CLU79DRAFT_753091 [Phycomyces nitens]
MLIQTPFSFFLSLFHCRGFPCLSIYFFNTRQKASYNVVDYNGDYFSSTQSTKLIFRNQEKHDKAWAASNIKYQSIY